MPLNKGDVGLILSRDFLNRCPAKILLNYQRGELLFVSLLVPWGNMQKGDQLILKTSEFKKSDGTETEFLAMK